MSTVDKKQKKAMIEAAASPISLVPFIGLGTSGALMLAFGASPAIAAGIAVVGVAVGAGTALFRAFNSDVIKEKVSKEIFEEQKIAREREINELKWTLNKEEVSLLDDVLGLQQVLESNLVVDFAQQELIVSTKELLERTYLTIARIPKLYKVKKSVSSSKRATEAIKDQMNKILTEVKANIDCAATVVAELQGLGNRTSGHGEIRKQLSGRLEAAKVFDGQLAGLELSIAPQLLSQYAQAAS